MDERRSYKRYCLIVSVKYSYNASRTKGSAKTKNISNGGICLTSHQKLLLNHLVDLEFSMPRKKIKVLGKVVWSEESLPHLYENGIEFVDIEESDKKEISNYINTR
ncbi:MAG: PilZ domain-containing protein [Spirochaetales bacterium]|nr:PilZ domain-containing protein [Spirochaetales bacterium]